MSLTNLNALVAGRDIAHGEAISVMQVVAFCVCIGHSQGTSSLIASLLEMMAVVVVLVVALLMMMMSTQGNRVGIVVGSPVNLVGIATAL